MCTTFIAAAVAAAIEAAGCVVLKERPVSVDWDIGMLVPAPLPTPLRHSARTHCCEYFQAAVEMRAIEVLHDNISLFRVTVSLCQANNENANSKQ